nr:thioredoxin domain-containing protein 15 [Leptinotarsa decemlineata]
MGTEAIYFNCLLIASLVSCLICQENLVTENVNLSQETNIVENLSETSPNSTINEDELPAESANKTQKFVNCLTGMGDSAVQLTNDTELFKLLQSNVNITDREIPSLCVVVLFYKKYCPFSALAAPHFNALPRAFPDIKMVAINAKIFHMLNTQNGIVGVPTLMLFHNGRSVAKYNGSEYTLELFSQFINRHTGIAAAEKSTVTSADFAGPVKTSPVKDYDIFLIISWLFVIMCGGYYFTKSRWWEWIIESIQSNWRESEAHAQHEHIE